MEAKSTGVIFDIKKYAVHDGPGIRTTIFLKGCPLNCWWCHNPEGQNPEPEIIWRDQGMKKEIIGREVSVDDVMEEIIKDLIFYDESGGGVTFSGGEPLMRPVFLNNLLSKCQEYEIKTTLDTCGYASWETISKVKDMIDLFLYDIKIIDDTNHQKYTGVPVKLILSNLRKLDRDRKKIILRFPIIPGITDTEENVSQLTNWLTTLENVKEINLLPFHKIGYSKYEKLKRKNQLLNLDSPSQERLTQLLENFRNLGFDTKLGG